MRRGQPTLLFAFLLLVGLVRVFAYAATPIGQELSVAVLAEALVLQVLAFALAAFVVSVFSRATAARAAQVALYAQGILFLAPFVDVGLGLSVSSYEDTYAPGLGTPGALVASLAYACVIAWGVWEASPGEKGGRPWSAGAAGVVAVAGLLVVSIPWARPFILTYVSWAVHLGLAVSYGGIACLLLALAIRTSSRSVHRQFWRRPGAWTLPAFAVLPFAGLVLAGLLTVPATESDLALRLRLDVPYMGLALAVGCLLWTQRRLVRETAWGPHRLEFAMLTKVVLLLAAVFLGWSALLMVIGAASVVWLERDRPSALAVATMAALAVLVGNMAAEAVDFADLVVGPATITVSVAQWALPTMLGLAAAVAAGVVFGGVAWATSRTSGSGTSRASS